MRGEVQEYWVRSCPPRIVAALVAAAFAMTSERDAPRVSQATLSEPAIFHHLHLISAGASVRADFYARLFAPSAVTRGAFWGIEGVQGRDAYLLVSPPAGSEGPNKGDTTIWHFGWGAVTVGETYRSHYAKEVNWRPPYEALEADFHVHLRSPDPYGAGRWYRDVLGGILDEGSVVGRETLQDERVDAIVTFRHVRLALHRWKGPLVSTRESGAVDHLAFLVRDPARTASDARRGGTSEGSPVGYPLATLPTTAVDGPDGIVIELLQAQRGPGFWDR